MKKSYSYLVSVCVYTVCIAIAIHACAIFNKETMYFVYGNIL